MQTHHSLIAWQRAKSFALEIHRVTGACWRPQYAEVISQLRRSALSVQLNIAEGYALRTDGLFRRHLTIAYGSAVEAVDALGLLIALAPSRNPDLEALELAGGRCCALVLALKHSIARREMGS
jgi:four helix bundle protein